MKEDFDREKAPIPDPETYVLHYLMIRDIERLLQRHSKGRHAPATIAAELGEILSRYVEGSPGGTRLKSVEKTKPKRP